MTIDEGRCGRTMTNVQSGDADEWMSAEHVLCIVCGYSSCSLLFVHGDASVLDMTIIMCFSTVVSALFDVVDMTLITECSVLEYSACI